jgi:hypothetical protein
LSEHTDNPELEDEEMTRVIETDAREDEERWIDSESDGDVEPRRGGGRDRGGWDDGEEAELAPRPRGRLLRPLPLLLIAVTIAAAGFLGGVLAQKGSEGGAAAGGFGGAGGLPSFAAAKEGASTEGASTSEAPSFSGSGASTAAATGTVTSIEGNTIYVKESGGTVVAVKAGDGSTVTRDSNVSAKKIHPGDTVVVEGSKHGSTVRASSIAATESGVESTAGFGAPGVAESGGSETETSVESLFEE